MPEKIGNLLVRAGIISQEQLNRALREQAKTPGERLGHTLVKLGYIGRKQMVDFLEMQKKKRKSWIEKLFGK
ncbi:TPA: hypothetical protein DCX16_05880 [bacterium]|nr:hypothetical protein [bacterium]